MALPVHALDRPTRTAQFKDKIAGRPSDAEDVEQFNHIEQEIKYCTIYMLI